MVKCTVKDWVGTGTHYYSCSTDCTGLLTNHNCKHLFMYQQSSQYYHISHSPSYYLLHPSLSVSHCCIISYQKITRCNAPLPSSLLLHSHIYLSFTTFHLPSFTFFRLTFLLHIFSLYSLYKKGLDCTKMWLLWPRSSQTQKSK